MNPPAPRQRVDVTITGAEFRTSKAGNLMAVLSATDAGESLKWFGMMTDAPTADGSTRAAKTVDTLRSIGMVGQDIGAIIGKRATFVTETETDPATGDQRRRVAFVNPAPTAADADTVAAVFHALGLGGTPPADNDAEEIPF